MPQTTRHSFHSPVISTLDPVHARTPDNRGRSFLLAPRANFAFLADTERDSAVRTVPLCRSRWDFLQAYAFQMEPFFLALHVGQHLRLGGR